MTVDSGIDSGKNCSILTIPVIDNDDVSQLMILVMAEIVGYISWPGP